MKKLLLAASVFTLSTSAMAETYGERFFAELVVKAQYVEPLTMELSTSEIDFGNVFTDTPVADITVTANIQGQPGLQFEFNIISSSEVIAVNTPPGLDMIGTDGRMQLGFMVGIDKEKLAENKDFIKGFVTVSIQYNDIPATINMGNT